MIFLPYRRKVFQTALSFDEVFKRLGENTSDPLKKLDVVAMIDKSSVFEMERKGHSFLIGRGIGTLRYRRRSSFPIMQGKLKKKSDFTQLYITVRPSSVFFSIILPLFLIIPAIYLGFKKPDFQAAAIGIFLLLVIYITLVVWFNRLYKPYLILIEETLSVRA